MASSFFNPKSKATRFLTGLCNLIIVNLLFMISCIPVFTIGASVTSLYRITIAIVAGDNPSIWRDYLKSFRDNFVKALLLSLIYLFLTAFFLFEIYMVNNWLEPKFFWAQYPAYFFLIMIFSSACYSFPLLAWFHETIPQLLKNSVLLAITNLPTTIMFIVFTGGLGYLLYEFTTVTMSCMILMGFSFVAFFYSLFLKRIFNKLGADISFDEGNRVDTDK